jgi:hypothetical protein
MKRCQQWALSVNKLITTSRAEMIHPSAMGANRRAQEHERPAGCVPGQARQSGALGDRRCARRSRGICRTPALNEQIEGRAKDALRSPLPARAHGPNATGRARLDQHHRSGPTKISARFVSHGAGCLLPAHSCRLDTVNSNPGVDGGGPPEAPTALVGPTGFRLGPFESATLPIYGRSTIIDLSAPTPVDQASAGDGTLRG